MCSRERERTVREITRRYAKASRFYAARYGTGYERSSSIQIQYIRLICDDLYAPVGYEKINKFITSYKRSSQRRLYCEGHNQEFGKESGVPYSRIGGQCSKQQP
jgi:hypothetical protein